METDTARNEPRDPQTGAVLAAAIEVHRTLGCGFFEQVYEQALIVELTLRSIPFQTELTLDVRYKGELLPTRYRPDLVCFGSVIVEIKALPALTPTHQAQALNYLKVSALERALLLNFGGTRLECRRVILSADRRQKIESDQVRP